jgi:hypothetical protein
MNNDTYLQKIKAIAKRMDELDTELMEYRNAQIRLENEIFRLLEELYDELQKEEMHSDLNKDTGNGLKLVREDVYGWNAYQFFVDEKGKRYLKYISAVNGEGLWFFTFSEDDTLQSIKDQLPDDDEIIAVSLFSMFKDGTKWKVDDEENKG